ncbi:MAG: hypothetical protein ACO1SX_25735 [Actinomycetota bacterium]
MSRTASPRNWLSTLTLAAVISLVPAAAEAQEILPVNPQATYLHTANADANALPAVAIDLNALGLQPGDPIRLERLGAFAPGGSFPDQQSMIGVFSSTDILDPATATHRVPGAIDAGADVLSRPTFVGAQPTDIPEDFAITGAGVVLDIPAGAQFLFVSPNDSYFADNSDPDGDYTLRITLLDTDRDGVLDDEDDCIPSDLRPWVDTGAGPTSVPNAVDAHGCSIQDYVNAFQSEAKNHGQYVNAIARFADDLARQGVINNQQKSELVSGAARFDID